MSKHRPGSCPRCGYEMTGEELDWLVMDRNDKREGQNMTVLYLEHQQEDAETIIVQLRAQIAQQRDALDAARIALDATGDPRHDQLCGLLLSLSERDLPHGE